MNKTLFLLTGLFCLASFCSCGDKEEIIPPFLNSSDAGKTITARGYEWEGWGTTLQTNISFSELEAVCNASWCSAELSKQSDGSCLLTILADDNPTLSERIAIITVKAVNTPSMSVAYTLKQSSGKAFIRFSGEETDMTVGGTKGVWERPIESNVEKNRLKATSADDWCTPIVETAPNGSLVLKMTLKANESIRSRTTTITVKQLTSSGISERFKLKQLGMYDMLLSHQKLGFDRDGGERTVAVLTELPWQAECTADWVTLEKGEDILTIHLASTTTERSTQVTFKDLPDKIITITQSKYKAGDPYDEDGITGTVGYIGDDKRFVYRLAGENLKWRAQDYASGEGAIFESDGEWNTKIIRDVASKTTRRFPAFEAVDELNTGGVTGWYLPAIGELNHMASMIAGETWSSTESYVLSAKYHDGHEARSKNKGFNLLVYAIHKF